MYQIETDGEGLYLWPASGKGFETVGNGLYLMKQGGLYDGRGLILGPNSPFLVWFCNISFRNKILYTISKLKLMKLMVLTDIYIVLKHWRNTGNINRWES